LLVSGSDEAGRGSVIGPLVIATVLIDEEDEGELREIGAKDSKKLSPKRREELYKIIVKICKDYRVSYISPRVIDSYVARKVKMRTLNFLEAKVIAEHLAQLNPSVAYLDSPYSRPVLFKKMVSEILKKREIKIVSANKAEDKWVEVACASIIAKVSRDRAIRRLKKKYGNFGSGYPSDLRTVNFLKQIISTNKKPKFVRWSWKTISELMPKEERIKKLF